MKESSRLPFLRSDAGIEVDIFRAQGNTIIDGHIDEIAVLNERFSNLPGSQEKNPPRSVSFQVHVNVRSPSSYRLWQA